MDVLIVGYGVVGHNLAKGIERIEPEIYDKYKKVDTRSKDKYDLCVICVDTPLSEDLLCDTTEVENALKEHDADIYVLKSTVLPHTTEKLIEATGKSIVFSPEYYGSTQHCNNFDFDFTILGGERNACLKVIQILQEVFDARHTFRKIGRAHV